MPLENISNENIINGMKKSLNNADSLLSEAFLLQSNKKFARAYTLCQIAIEELAKIQMLFELWIDRINGNTINYKLLNDNFKDHPTKTKISIETEIAFFKLMKEQTGYEWIDKLISKGDELLTKVKELNNLKNESLYVSIKNDGFQSPEEIIDEGKYQSISASAFMRQQFFKNMIRVCVEHIEEIAKLIKEDDKVINKSS